MSKLEKKYNREESESKWQKYWEDEKIFKFDPDAEGEIYSVDTPPPTVSGRMHIGHAFSYTQADILVRYQRMIGKNIFYPFGTDDNGLPTQRLVEKERGVRSTEMSRKEFVKLCLDYLKEELPSFIQDWKDVGMSCDFDVYYSTIDDHSRRISQRSFIDLYKMGREYRKEAPTVWCPTCRTAISQVEMEDKELESTFNDIRFVIVKDQNRKSDQVIIATTRPELLPACVAVIYHPKDKRYLHLEGQKAVVPIFGHEVPFIADERVDMEKGTGIVMNCTFGDQTDMEWQKAFDLPIKTAIAKDGKMTKIAGKYEGLKIKEARKQILIDLKEQGFLKSQKNITHDVNVHERCGTELEFIVSKQWFIKYLDLKDEMLKWGNELNWYPKYMKNRYDNWVKGLQWDWCISRQIAFGIPFPVWYCKKCDETILADKEDLPVDPTTDDPPVNKCPKCGHDEIIPESDIINTWATSSLTPQLSTELFKDHKVYKKLFPMNYRPQAHDIITFWLFNTMVKSRLHYKVNPWQDTVVKGHVLDPKGKKMSKSKGNVVDPRKVLKNHGADAIRYWTTSATLGSNLRYNEEEVRKGSRVITKLWNVGRLIEMHLTSKDHVKTKHQILKTEGEGLEYADLWILNELANTIDSARKSFDVYNFSKARDEIDSFFWSKFTDYYIEFIKYRLFGDDESSKQAALSTLMFVYQHVLKLYAPILSFVTEELYQHFFLQEGERSIHLVNWAESKDIRPDNVADIKDFDDVIKAIDEVRKYKSEKGLSQGAELDEYELKSDVDLKKYQGFISKVVRVKNLIKNK